ncbi:hypothetical protein ACJX0J_017954, partial [Zea mays]
KNMIGQCDTKQLDGYTLPTTRTNYIYRAQGGIFFWKKIRNLMRAIIREIKSRGIA